jgi:hypothetical protein
MATYTNVTLQEMTDFLGPQGFKAITVRDKHGRPNVETIFGKRVDTGGVQLTCRILSGIVGDNSRGVGEDAIRVQLWSRKRKSEPPVRVTGSKRVHRVINWRNNLQDRIDKITKELKLCPKCKAPMKIRDGRNGEFLGCTSYPACKFTQNLPDREGNGK